MKNTLPRTKRTTRARRVPASPDTLSHFTAVPPDPREVEQFARSVWQEEGARPGLLAQCRHEVESQLRFTRHLLVGDLIPGLNNRHNPCA